MRVLKYSVVGGTGFLVDAGVLSLLVHVFDVNAFLSRLGSFAVAVLVTWLLNRRFVFTSPAGRNPSRVSELSKYLSVQIGGALTNLAVFAILILAYERLEAFPVIPLAIGALFGLAITYLGARNWVFRDRPTEFSGKTIR